MGKQGDFYAIDRRTWALVCNQGMNPAVAYNVLAAFSRADNANTEASTNAIEKYTGISRSRARAAIDDLVASGFVKRTQVGTRPHHELVSYAELPSVKPYDLARLTGWNQDFVGRIKDGNQPAKYHHKDADELVKLGVLLERDGRYIVRPPPDPKPDLIWLPNDLVTGTSKQETPPVERVRQTSDVMCLRLLVDLYHAQNLTDDGGITREVIFKKYVRTKVAEVLPFTIWSFSIADEKRYWIRWGEITNCHKGPTDENGNIDGTIFSQRLEFLTDMGLLEWVRYLAESDRSDAELVHPMGMIAQTSGDTVPTESQPVVPAYKAAMYLLQRTKVAPPPESFLIPALRHQANVAMVGVARLRYRPRTSNASKWYAELVEGCTRWKEHYNAMAEGDFSRIKATG